MQFLIKAHDGKDMLERRMSVRPRHLENMMKLGKSVVCGGGLLNEEGKPIGSALIVDFESREQLDAYLASEPYIQEKVWETVEVEPINVVMVNGEKVGK